MKVHPLPLAIQSWYINVHRVLERVGIENIRKDVFERLKAVAGSSLEKGMLVSVVSPIVVSWIQQANILPLETHILSGNLKKGLVFTFEAKFRSRGLAGGRDLKGTETVVLRHDLTRFGEKRELVLEFHSDNLTTSTARGALMGQPSVFVLAFIEKLNATQICARPYVIGNLVEDRGMPLRYRESLELHLDRFDAFSKVNFAQRISKSDLEQMKDFPEAKIKEFFAEVLGETHIPKDWGGEICDLFTEASVEGKRHSCAFLLKGPSVFRPMEPRDCGKNGDQIVRLFNAPAEIFILQHCHKVQPAVRSTMSAFAKSDLNFKRQFCIVDGCETLKLLRHFGKV